jgi:hypothetical protein
MPVDTSTIAPEAPAFPLVTEPTDFDERWAAWQAKNAAHDRAVRRKMQVAVPLMIVLIAVILYALVGR